MMSDAVKGYVYANELTQGGGVDQRIEFHPTEHGDHYFILAEELERLWRTEEKVATVRKQIQISNDANGRLIVQARQQDAKIRYYESALCFPGVEHWRLPNGVMAKEISPERVADVMCEREELLRRVQELEGEPEVVGEVHDG